MSNNVISPSSDMSGELADVIMCDPETGGALASFELDSGKYLGELAEYDMTEAQKIELLQTLWSILSMMVEMGFQEDICGRLFGASAKFASAETNSLSSLQQAGAVSIASPPER